MIDFIKIIIKTDDGENKYTFYKTDTPGILKRLISHLETKDDPVTECCQLLVYGFMNKPKKG